MKYTLRPYQEESIQAALNYFVEREGNPLIELPTGAGKSLVTAGVIERVREHFPSFRTCMATHVKELIQQNAEKIESLLPRERVSVYSAGLGRREFRSHIVCAGIQSVYRKADKVGPIDLLIIDEAHLVSSSGQGMYRDFIRDLRVLRPDMKVLGLTATPFRTGEGYLTEGEDALFRSVCYRVKVGEMVDAGWLSSIVTRPAEIEINMSGAKVSGGEFRARDVKAATDDFNTPEAVEEILRLGAARKSWLVFCGSVEHATMVTEMLREKGVVAQMITGKTNKVARGQMLGAFRQGRIKCIVNVNVLTTGFDAPGIDLIALLRPTASPGLYVQMVGRGFRKAEGKTDCLLLDFGGNIERHGPLDSIRPKRKASEGGSAPFKTCEQCALEVAAAIRVCPDCGFEFPAPKTDATSKTAATGSVIKSEPVRHEVGRVAYWVHEKRGIKSLRVEYFANTLLPVAKEWVCFDHEGFPRRNAEDWWGKRTGDPVPDTTSQALITAHSLRQPRAITVGWDGKYSTIDEYIWGSEGER